MRKTRFGNISSFANLCWYFFIIQGSKEGLKICLDDAFLVRAFLIEVLVLVHFKIFRGDKNLGLFGLSMCISNRINWDISNSNDRYFFNGLGLENILAALTRELGNGPCFRKNRLGS